MTLRSSSMTARTIVTIPGSHHEDDREAEFRYVVHAMPHLAWITAPDGRMTFVNNRWVEHTGLTTAAMQGISWMQALHDDDRAAAQASWMRATETGDAYS